VDSYQRRPADAARGDSAAGGRDTVNDAAAFLRRLIPFPGPEVLSPLSLLSLAAQQGGMQSNPLANAMPDIVSQQAASIVSQAASILDEEMAKGVLAAQRSGATAPHGQSDASNALLRQVHDLVNNVAAIWPSLQNPIAPRSVAPPPAASDADALAELRPRATVRPGQRATISMTLRNSESHSVRLVPVATDLLGSGGGRIASSLLAFTPSEISLEPQEQRDMAIATTVPAGTARGCYSGLLVVMGLDYLRALITIDVV
jgi:hypothetical protein